jgi:inositol-phosphate transport system ATP-binding protein
MPGVTLDRISMVINKKKVIDDLSMRIEEGSFVCLLGPAGSGKTTLLKIIAGLTTPSSGSVFFDDANVTAVEPNKRNVSMVFQDFALYPHMNVFKNIASPLLAKKLPKQEVKKKVTDVAKFLKIDRFLDRNISHLSGGEMQRVAIGRALSKEAKIMLFDEIFVNLDYKLREQMRIEFKELMERVKLTTIFSSPDPEDAFSLADKIAVMHEGKILQYDSRDVVYNKPVDVFTGGYFGYPEMNFLDCSISEKNGKYVLDADFFHMPVKQESLVKKLKPGPCVVGLRPEHVKLVDEGPGESGAHAGRVFLTEVIGSDTIVHIEVGKHTLEVFTPGIYRETIGKQVHIGFDPQLLYMFDKETGQFIGRGA